jgi:hypothetical protein
MKSTIHKTAEPVVLDGYQAILKPTEYGFTLKCILTDETIIDALNAEREELMQAQQSRLKNPKRATPKPEPWEEVAEGSYALKFSWKATNKPAIVDAEGVLIDNENLKVFSGSKVKIAFIQKGYTLKDGVTYGTSVTLLGVQIISLSSNGDPTMSAEEAAGFFGKTDGFKLSEFSFPEAAQIVDDEVMDESVGAEEF